MNKKEFLRERGFVKVEKGKYARERDGNKEQLDLDSMTAYVHDENHRFTDVPEKLYDILKVVEIMEDMNQRQLDEWIEGLESSSKGQMCLTDFKEE